MNGSLIMLVVNLLMSAACVGGLLLLYRRQRSLEPLVRECDTLQRDVAALCAAERCVGDRVALLESEGRKILDTQTRLELRSPAEAHYRQAIALAARGAAPGELIRDCGLERSEAELVARLHRVDEPQGAPSAPVREIPGQLASLK